MSIIYILSSIPFNFPPDNAQLLHQQGGLWKKYVGIYAIFNNLTGYPVSDNIYFSSDISTGGTCSSDEENCMYVVNKDADVSSSIMAAPYVDKNIQVMLKKYLRHKRTNIKQVQLLFHCKILRKIFALFSFVMEPTTTQICPQGKTYCAAARALGK